MSAGIAIVGAALSDIGAPGLDGVSIPHELAAQASLRALADAGLESTDVDGLLCCGFGMDPTLEFADYLGLRHLTFVDSTCVGGSSWVTYLEHAAAAIASGLCTTALIAHGALAYSDRRRPFEIWSDDRAPINQFDHASGNSFVTAYALAAQRYLWQHRLESDALAAVAVSTREWAALNPLARFRDPITTEDVLTSPLISSPFHLLDCCVISDGGGAVVVTAAERASGTRAPIYVAGVASLQAHLSIAQMTDLTITPAAETGPRALRMAGLRPTDIDLLMLYDAFTIIPLLLLEDLGFAVRGEAAELFASGATAPGGALPVNTNGGGLSFCHTGMYGIFTLLEAVTQLRGEAGQRQVPNVEHALAHGVGEFFSAAATAILTRTPR